LRPVKYRLRRLTAIRIVFDIKTCVVRGELQTRGSPRKNRNEPFPEGANQTPVMAPIKRTKAGWRDIDERDE